LDGNQALMDFSAKLEQSVIETVESGKMTKDLAILAHNTNNPARNQYLNTFEFIDACAEALNKKLGA